MLWMSCCWIIPCWQPASGKFPCQKIENLVCFLKFAKNSFLTLFTKLIWIITTIWHMILILKAAVEFSIYFYAIDDCTISSRPHMIHVSVSSNVLYFVSLVPNTYPHQTFLSHEKNKYNRAYYPPLPLLMHLIQWQSLCLNEVKSYYMRFISNICVLKVFSCQTTVFVRL